MGAGNFPKHRTICGFRALHLPELAALFVQVVKLAWECGLVRLGTVAVDGTKLKANASKHKAMSYGRMPAAEAAIRAQIDALLARAAQADQAEAGEPDLDVPAEVARREQRQREADARRMTTARAPAVPARRLGPPSSGPSVSQRRRRRTTSRDPNSRIMKMQHRL